MLNNIQNLESALLSQIESICSDSGSSDDIYIHLEITGRFSGGEVYRESAVSTNGTNLPSRVENIEPPSPPQYPPPHGRNSPAFFPLSCTQAPQIDARMLHLALRQALEEVPSQVKVPAELRESESDSDNDTGTDSDSSDEDTWAQFYVKRNYEMERQEEIARERTARVWADSRSKNEIEDEDGASENADTKSGFKSGQKREDENNIENDGESANESATESDFESDNESEVSEDSGYESEIESITSSDDDDDGDEEEPYGEIDDHGDNLDWIHDGGEMIAPY